MNGGTLESTPITDRQAEVMKLVQAYCDFHGTDGCPASFVADRLKLHYSTVREHFAVLHRKGWLVSESCPATPTRRFLDRR